MMYTPEVDTTFLLNRQSNYKSLKHREITTANPSYIRTEVVTFRGIGVLEEKTEIKFY